MAERKATTTWKGNLFEGSGTFSVGSGAFADQAVDWPARADEPPSGKTSPEELIAAAHATCFAMSLANILAQNKTPADSLEVTATSTFGKTDAGFRITNMHLDLTGSVPGIDSSAFEAKAAEAKVKCPVSNALVNNVEISFTANLK